MSCRIGEDSPADVLSPLKLPLSPLKLPTSPSKLPKCIEHLDFWTDARFQDADEALSPLKLPKRAGARLQDADEAGSPLKLPKCAGASPRGVDVFFTEKPVTNGSEHCADVVHIIAQPSQPPPAVRRPSITNMMHPVPSPRKPRKRAAAASSSTVSSRQRPAQGRRQSSKAKASRRHGSHSGHSGRRTDPFEL